MSDLSDELITKGRQEFGPENHKITLFALYCVAHLYLKNTKKNNSARVWTFVDSHKNFYILFIRFPES